jgi:hypothetical protein
MTLRMKQRKAQILEFLDTENLSLADSGGGRNFLLKERETRLEYMDQVH